MKGEAESSLEEAAKKVGDKITFLTATSKSAHAVLNSGKRVALKVIVSEVDEPAQLKNNCESISKPKIVSAVHDDHEEQLADRVFWIW
jgi:hypothetical protein